MKPRLARTAAAPLVYWLVLLSGLTAAHHVFDLAEPAEAHVVWAAAIGGTVLGQVMAWRRLSLWVVLVVVPALIVTSISPGLVLLQIVEPISKNPGRVVELVVETFVPAALCGYASLSERGALAALWFPTSIWMLGILDGAHGDAFAGKGSWLLLGALAALFVAFLHARESRRVELWRTRAEPRLSVPRPGTVLRRAPLRTAAQIGWVAITGAAALLLTAWIAPRLWHKDVSHDVSHRRAVASAAAAGESPTSSRLAGAAAGAAPLPCCPAPDDVSRHHVREYLPLLHADHADDDPTEPGVAACVACVDGVPAPRHVDLHGLHEASGCLTCVDGVSAPPRGAAMGEASGATGLWSPSTGATTPSASAPAALSPPPPGSRPQASGPEQAISPAQAQQQQAWASESRDRAALPGPSARVDLGDACAWLAAATLAWLALQLLLRPLRRRITLWHLEHPLFAEPADQRVSNLWQLVLIGLRDAGWIVAPGEQPRELARRVSLPGMDVCAIVLERARHGLRVDDADLAAMGESARAAYRAAREKASPLVRAAACLRWPLV